jgi:hypothetical protein
MGVHGSVKEEESILYQGGGQWTSDEQDLTTSDATRLIYCGIVFCKQEVFVGWD